MRVTPAERKLFSIKEKTTRFIFRRCGICKDDIKGETVWKHKDHSGYSSISRYACKRCLPNKFKAYEHYFDEPWPSAK